MAAVNDPRASWCSQRSLVQCARDCTSVYELATEKGIHSHDLSCCWPAHVRLGVLLYNNY